MEKKKRGRPWKAPKSPAKSGAKGQLTREDLILKVRERGLTAREARSAVKAIFETIQDDLLYLHKAETPLGTFYFKPQPKTQKRIRFGKQQTLFRKRRKVAFKPSKVLQGTLDSQILPEPPPVRPRKPPKPLKGVALAKALNRLHKKLVGSDLEVENLEALHGLCGTTPVLLERLRLLADRKRHFDNPKGLINAIARMAGRATVAIATPAWRR
jgi:nucleoid DNA-binding protein